jgi:urease accessory protein
MTGPADGLAALLMLADARMPAGGHAHSGGLEPAVTAGLLRAGDPPALDSFLAGRLTTTGLTAAGLSAAACAHAAGMARPTPEDGWTSARTACGKARAEDGWDALDAEADARTPSPAQRDASRQQGRTLLRAGRAGWPAAWLDRLAATPGGAHHPVVLGAVAAAAGCTPHQAALAAAYLSVSGPASAAVRLLSLDPIAVNASLARLAPRVEAIAAEAVRDDLPCPSAPGLDLLAEAHARSEVRLFVS